MLLGYGTILATAPRIVTAYLTKWQRLVTYSLTQILLLTPLFLAQS